MHKKTLLERLRQPIAALREIDQQEGSDCALGMVVPGFLRAMRLRFHFAHRLIVRFAKKLRHAWHLIQQLSGDSAYAQYLQHHADFHASSVDVPAALSRKAFYKLWQDQKWTGVKRCC